MNALSHRGKVLCLLLLYLVLLGTVSLFGVSNSDVRDTLVSVTVRVDNVDAYGEVYSFGSGFFVAENGLLCTNFHVIEDHFTQGLSLRVLTNDGATHEARPVVWNYERDWALLQIDSYYSPDYLEFAQSVQLLDTIWSAGYPVTGNLKISQGSVSSYQPDFMGSGQNYYDVSMKFDGGNSGGPVINEALEAVGIVVAYYTEARDMDFIIPIDEIVNEIYWARYITGSVAYIPYEISGIIPWDEELFDEEYYLSFYNDTGYDIAYLYVLDEQMFYDDQWGSDVLGDYYLYDGDYTTVDPYEYPWIDAALQDDFSIMTIVAVDDEGDLYIKDFYPALDSWDITITFDDYLP